MLASSEGMIETLAMRGRVVPLGAAGICWAVNVDVISFTMNRIPSNSRIKTVSKSTAERFEDCFT
jgi:hypothetical protein